MTDTKKVRPRGSLLKEAVQQAQAAIVEAPEELEEEEFDIRRAVRAPLREEDSRERAARRAAEIREHGVEADEGHDDFAIPQNIIPDGWSYEWKRRSVYGAEDPAYMQSLIRKGWEPVPTSRHPEFMSVGEKNPNIERKGMILMERPMELTIDARNAELRRARSEVKGKEAQLNAASDGQFDRNLAKVGKSYEAMPIPKD